MGTIASDSAGAFFGLTFLVTWTCFITAAVLSRDVMPGSGASAGLRALILFGTFAPAMVALGLTARAQGGQGVRALLDPLLRWQVKARWYAFAAGYMAAIKLTVALVHRLATGAWPRFGSEAWYLMAAATVFSTVIGGQSGEEIGWRGYALPRMARRFGLAGASLVLGVSWAVWHLPLFWFHGADTYAQSFPVYLLQVTALSVAIAWLYWRTGGSLLLTMLMHAAVDNTLGIVPSGVVGATNPFAWSTSRVAWLTLGLLWAGAACFLVDMRRAGRLENSRQSIANAVDHTI